MRQTSASTSALEQEASRAVAEQIWRFLQAGALSADELATRMDLPASSGFTPDQIESTVQFVMGHEGAGGRKKRRGIPDRRRHRRPTLEWLERRDLLSSLVETPPAAHPADNTELQWHFSASFTRDIAFSARDAPGRLLAPPFFASLGSTRGVWDAFGSDRPSASGCDVALASAGNCWRFDLDAALAQIAADVNHAWAA